MFESLNYIPDTDIMGRKLEVGDKVTVFNKHFISWDNCIIVERDYNTSNWDAEEADMRRAIEVDGVMYIFGLGNHELIKEAK